MLEPLLASTNCERVLIFLAARDEGYLREMADFFQTSPSPLLKQLEKLETGGSFSAVSPAAPASMDSTPGIRS